MGTTVSNLQILDVPEDAVRAALPHALVGTWSERFVTACPDLGPRQLERRAASLSKRMECTLLLTAMLDGDALWLTLYQNGKRLTGHKALPSPDACVVGNPKLFCSALGLPEELTPKLRRLFADCTMQEEKLAILQTLLGAPLFLRWDSEPSEEPVTADSAPLIQWVMEHPLPPKIKNQCKAELIQEIPDRGLEYGQTDVAMILRPTVRKDDDYKGWYTKHRAGDILGRAERGGEWCRPLPDGRLELIPLVDPLIPYRLWMDAFPEGGPPPRIPSSYEYAVLDGRMVTTTSLYPPKPDDFGAYTPGCSAILHDTAGILTSHILTLDGEPATGKFHLLPDGGFLAAVAACCDDSRPPVQTRPPALACYGPDGMQRWRVWGVSYVVKVVNDLIYAVTDYEGEDRDQQRLLAINMDGTVIAQCAIPFSPYSTGVHFIEGTPYLLEPLGYQKDDLLHRLTPDLLPDGDARVPSMSSLALSPDQTLLYCAGYHAGLQVMDAATLQTLRRMDRPDDFSSPIVDGQNRLWVSNKSYSECYDSGLALISRHRLAGSPCSFHRTLDGDICAVTFQNRRYLIRVYRFS